MKNIAIIPEGGSKRYLKRIFSFWKLTVIGSFLYNMHWRIAKLLMRSMSTDDETIKQTALAYGQKLLIGHHLFRGYGAYSYGSLKHV
jgi:hypothetical protein